MYNSIPFKSVPITFQEYISKRYLYIDKNITYIDRSL